MILVDTPIWIDHLRDRNDQLASLLNSKKVFCHPLVIGELAMGSLRDREDFLWGLERLKRTPNADLTETLTLVEKERLYALGIGLVDAMILASCLLDERVRLWTRDKRLNAIADRFGIAYQPLH